MPIYEYACRACGDEFEALQKINDAPLTACTECGKEGKVQRLLSLSAFHLQGGGWYKDDYGKGASQGNGATNGNNGNGTSDKSKEKSNGGTETSSKSEGSGSKTKGGDEKSSSSKSSDGKSSGSSDAGSSA